MDSNAHIGHRNRLRERIIKNGFSSLFPHELLEYILFGAIKQGDTNALSHKIIAAFGDLDKVFSASIEQLMQVDGVGEGVATLIASYSYLNSILSKPKAIETNPLNSLGKIREYLLPFFLGKSREEFHVLLLSPDFSIIRHIVMSSPITNKVYVDMDEVINAVSMTKPSAVVFSHNHPSGVVTPSKQDVEFTKRYFSALNLAFNVVVCEHMIFNSSGECYSFRNGGDLEKIVKIIENTNNITISDITCLGGFNE